MKGLEPIDHALFVDDYLLLGGSSITILKVFYGILRNFYKISGAIIYKMKSVVYGWNVGQQTIQKISQFLGFSGYASWEKINYLGLLLTLGTNKASLWVEVISKIKTKIAG